MNSQVSLIHIKAIRLADLADLARRVGRIEQADRFFMLAWAAYDELDLVDHRATETDTEQAAIQAEANRAPGQVLANAWEAVRTTVRPKEATYNRTQPTTEAKKIVAR